MIKKDKELIVKNDNLITKLFSKIRFMFNRGKEKKHNEEEDNQSSDRLPEKKEGLNNLYPHTTSGVRNPYDEKRRVLALFNTVKKGTTKIQDLSGADLVLVNKLLKDEIDIIKSHEKFT